MSTSLLLTCYKTKKSNVDFPSLFLLQHFSMVHFSFFLLVYLSNNIIIEVFNNSEDRMNGKKCHIIIIIVIVTSASLLLSGFLIVLDFSALVFCSKSVTEMSFVVLRQEKLMTRTFVFASTIYIFFVL